VVSEDDDELSEPHAARNVLPPAAIAAMPAPAVRERPRKARLLSAWDTRSSVWVDSVQRFVELACNLRSEDFRVVSPR
jgi:hypothetical protein